MKLITGLGCLGFLVLWGSLCAVVLAVAGGGFGTASDAPLGATGSLLWPVHGQITDRFGSRINPLPPHNEEQHWGVDIAADSGTPVLAATEGEVISTTWAGGYGNLIILLGPDRLVTYYGHLSSFAVERGQKVGQGEVIGFVGSTGRSTGPHLHFETRPNGGNPVDPLRYWGSTTTEQFVEKLMPYGAMAAAKLGVSERYAEFFVTHWAQESGFESQEWIGWHGAAYNYAGIRKGDVWCSYDSIEAFVQDYAQVLLTTRLNSGLAYGEVVRLMREGAPIDDVLDALGRSPWDEDHYGRSQGLQAGMLLHRRYAELAPWL